MIETVGSESVATVAERYQQRGFQVVFEPDPSLLPKEAKTLHPDLLASKGDEHVIVEVKYQQNLLGYPALMRLAEVIRRIPGWRLDVVVLEQPKRDVEAQPLSVEDAKRRLGVADRVAEGTADYAAALLLLWTAVEATLRDQVRKQSDDSLTSTSRLPKIAYSLGIIDSQDAATAEWMTRIRNDVVHGRTESVSKLDYDRAREFVIRLLAENRESELLAS